MGREEAPFEIKYRPTDFDEIMGNKETVQAIKDKLGQPNCPHTFLFCGPSGTGKTTLARIVRKKFGCGDMDFVELNAANTRGIDTIREIYNTSGFAPSSGKCRVYLIDECHQITGTAQEALLKITEDVPKHVYFIFSTTNPEKLITTLRKRCTTYKLELITRREIIKLLTWAMVEEKYPQEDIDYFTDVVLKIAKIADGCPREALILLNQSVSLSKDQALGMLDKHIMSGESQVIQLCQQLLGPDDWSAVSKTLSQLDGDAEQLRRGVLTYMGKVLMGGKLDVKALKIMRAFATPTYDTGKNGIVMAAATIKALS